jgi:hypothetical protein
VLTKVTTYNTAAPFDPLIWNVINRPDTDLFEVRNADGLGAVKADVNTVQMGSVDKEVGVGSSYGKRNLVFTIGLDPDWEDWTVSRLRRLLDKYFMPKTPIRLVFETMEFSPVEIFGEVESNEPNMFSKDPEHVISVICPDPDFVSVDAIQIDGSTDMDPLEIDYEGNVPSGIVAQVKTSADADPDVITISNTYNEALGIENFVVSSSSGAIPLDSTHSFMVSSIPGSKFAKLVGASEHNYLNDVMPGYVWPTFRQGINLFQIQTNVGVHPWSLSYYERFGSL